MGRVEFAAKTNELRVRLESDTDVAVLRVALKGADGADERDGFGRGDVVSLDVDNPFNYIALESTEFTWTPEALPARASVSSLSRAERCISPREVSAR